MKHKKRNAQARSTLATGSEILNHGQVITMHRNMGASTDYEVSISGDCHIIGHHKTSLEGALKQALSDYSEWLSKNQ